MKYIIEFINNQKQINKIKAKKIPALPNFIRYSDIESEINTIKQIPVGIGKKDLEIYTYNYLTNQGNIITSQKLTNTITFTKSLLNILKLIPKTSLIIIDPLNLLMLNKEEYPNYYHDNNLSSILDKLLEYISNLIETKNNTEGVILIYGLNKFINKLEDNKKMHELTKKLKTYEKISLIVADDAPKLKNYGYESWFTEIFNTNDGIWIGRGITDQNIIKISGINREMTKEIKKDMGYVIQDKIPTLCKFIDFITIDEDGVDNNGE